MNVLFVSSGNTAFGIAPFVKIQGESLKDLGNDLAFFPINGKGMKGYLKAIFKLRKYLRKNKFDVVHAHYSLTSFAVSIALIGNKTPLVVSLLGSDANSNLFEKTIIKIFNALFWNAIIVKSEDMLKQLKIKNCEVIPNGVDLDQIKDFKRKLPKNKPLTALFAADPSRCVKNYDLAEQVFDKIDPSIVKLKLIYNLPQPELYEELYHADMLISTSLWEGSPNLIKEAMACNCPIISTKVGDVEWLFGQENGFFLTSFDSNEIIKAVYKAAEFSLQKSNTNGRKRILELELDSNSVAKKINAVYKSILND